MSKKVFIGSYVVNSYAVIRANNPKEALKMFEKEFQQKYGFKPMTPAVFEVNVNQYPIKNDTNDTNDIYLL